MPLQPGSKIGHYEVLAKIGAGGMGEVYKARDNKLNREVAIKVLPAALANDADYLARFQREAQALAALHHPNIATIFGLEQNAIVMEYVEGAPLQGPLPIAELLPIAKQIAEALEAAHDKGIIHRDLKPANILLTPDGQVKILDFGLAKAVERTTATSANSPTLTLRATEAGLILGTAGYMAPEQAAGKPVDRRADIWSFGVVLYELITGEKLFDGETVSHTLAEVLKTEIDFNKIPAGPLRALLQRCLDRNLKNRLQHIGEARFAIENYSATPTAPAPATQSSRLPWLLTAGLATALAALAVLYIRTGKPLSSPGIRFELTPPSNQSFSSRVVLSPDGTKIAFSARAKGDTSAIWVRSLDELDARKLPGSEGAQNPVFWSPDSQSLAFSGSNLGKLFRIDLAGGQPQPLCTSSRNAPIGDWGKSGVILYRGAGGLMRVPASGGPCTLATAIDTKGREVEHSAPSFLPDGVHFLYLRISADPNLSGVFIGSLDKKPDQQDGNRLIPTESGALFAPDQNDPASGYLIYRQRDTLLARPFHPGRLAFTGPAVALTDISGPQGTLAASVSPNGILSYRNVPVERRNRINAFDRAGTEIESITAAGAYNSLALSPDGRRLAFDQGTTAGANTDIWVYDFERKSTNRLTFEIDSEYGPIWTANGQSIMYGASRPGSNELFLRDASGAGKEIPLSLAGIRIRPSDASRDGRFLLFGQEGNLATSADIYLAEFTNGGNPVTSPKPLLQTEFIERDAQFSPDGRYVSYTSNVTGRPEVFVRPINGEGQWMISTGGGGQGRWSSDGKELFFLSADSKLMAVPITFTPSFRAGSPVPLFPVRVSGTGAAGTGLARWAVAPGSRKFYFIVSEEETTSLPAIIVTNWQAALQKR